MSNFRTFFKNYSQLFSGIIVIQILGLISFPILTRILTSEEYGIMSLITTTMIFAVAIAKAGLSDGIIRFYKEYSVNSAKLEIFSSTIVLRGLILSGLTVTLYILIIVGFRSYFNISEKYLVCFLIMSIYLFFKPLNIIVLNVLRIDDKTFFFNLVNVFSRASAIALSLLFLILLIGDFHGYFVGIVLSELMIAFILYSWFLSKHKISFRKVSGELSLNLMKFGIPLLFSELTYLLLSYADRYMILSFKGEGALGIYSVGYNLSSYIGDMFTFALSYAVIPIYVSIYKSDGREKTEAFLKKCAHYFVIATISMSFGYVAVSKEIFLVLASEKYLSAASFSPLIFIGLLCLGFNSILNAGLYLHKRTVSILMIMLTSVALNIILNFLLIPDYGVLGASIATLAACIFSSIITIILSYRYLVIRFEFKKNLYYVLLSALMFFIITRIESESVWLLLGSKVLIGALLIGAGVLFMEKELQGRLKKILIRVAG